MIQGISRFGKEGAFARCWALFSTHEHSEEGRGYQIEQFCQPVSRQVGGQSWQQGFLLAGYQTVGQTYTTLAHPVESVAQIKLRRSNYADLYPKIC